MKADLSKKHERLYKDTSSYKLSSRLQKFCLNDSIPENLINS